MGRKLLTIGFTGTRHGMSVFQLTSLVRVWRSDVLLDPDVSDVELVHGCCVGSDEQADEIARVRGWKLHHRPGPDGPWRANLKDPDTLSPVEGYLQRDRKIAATVQRLYAAPDGPERVRSGTWATIRAARAVGIDVIIVAPDGSVKWEIARRPSDRPVVFHQEELPW